MAVRRKPLSAKTLATLRAKAKNVIIISENKNIGIDKLIEKIDKKERNGSLASAIRVFILKKFMKLN